MKMEATRSRQRVCKSMARRKPNKTVTTCLTLAFPFSPRRASHHGGKTGGARCEQVSTV